MPMWANHTRATEIAPADPARIPITASAAGPTVVWSAL
jgi:hypothetical protein